MRVIRGVFLWILMLQAFSSLAIAAGEGTRTVPDTQSSEDLTGATLDAMIGQMLMVGFGGTDSTDQWAAAVRDQVAAGDVGGVFFLRRNIRSRAQVSALTRYFASANPGLPPFLAIDQEGGQVQRLTAASGFRTSPSAHAIARRKTLDEASIIYGSMARQLRTAGFNLNLGPVVDVNTNPANPVIARLRRSYGSDPDKVAAFAGAFIDAHRQAGLLTAVKHYPGHGSSTTDSHLGFVDISKTWKHLELTPYRTLADAGKIDMVMVGHLYHVEFADGERTPATLSHKAVSGKLRPMLGNDVVVITDDMEMGAIRDLYSMEDAIVRAIAAGNDILLFSQTKDPSRDLPARFRAIVRNALASGVLNRALIEASYRRIVAMKRRLQR